MRSTQVAHHLSPEVSCRACPETCAVPLDVVDGGALHGPEPS